MNKKGFTLVELLAVIVIIGLIATIGVTSYSAIKKKIEIKMQETKMQLIIEAAKAYGEDHKNEIANKDAISVCNSTIRELGTARYGVNEVLIAENYYEDEELKNSCKGKSTSEDPNNTCAVRIKYNRTTNRIEACIIKMKTWTIPDEYNCRKIDNCP